MAHFKDRLTVAANDFHLTRLIFIDSYRPGDIVEIALDGHTNLNGYNGAGKTTLLRLIPLFYGESASKLLRGERSKKSFVEHYLPRSTSYVVFEYARRGQLCQAVLHSDASGDVVHYRFLGSEFRRDLFVIDDRMLVQSGQILRHATKLQVECTTPFSRPDYRAVIQNRPDKRELRQYAARYAFAGGTHRLTDIDKIVTGMFVRHTTFHELRQMVVSCIVENEGKIEIGARREAMETWSQDYQAYSRAMLEADRVAKLTDLDQARARSLAELSTAKGWLHRYSQDLTRRKAEHEAEEKRLKSSADEARLQAAQESAAERGLLTEAQTALRLASEQVADLDKRHRDYTAERIEKKAALVDELAQNEDGYERVKARREKLVGANKSISERYEALEAETQREADQAASRLTGEKDPIRVQAKQQREATQIACAERIEALRKHAEEERDILSEELNDFAAAIGRLEAQLESTQPDPLLADQFEVKMGAVEGARKALEALRLELQGADQKRTAARQQFGNTETDLQRAEQRLARVRDDIEHTLRLAQAAPDTLLGFLRREKPDWIHDIARIVPRELLLRTDLAPTLDEARGHSLYGIDLDVGRIEAPLHADEATIAQRLEELQAERESVEAKRAAAEQALKEAAAGRDEANATHERLSNDYRTLQSRYQGLQDEAKSLRGQVEQSRRQRRAATDEALGEARKEEQKRKDARAQINRDLADALTAETMLRRQEEKRIDAWESGEIASVNAKIGEVRRKCAADIEALREERNRSLAKEGVDTATLDRVERELKVLRDAIAAGREYQSVVAQYRNWLEGSWAKRGEYEEQQAACAIKVKQHEAALARIAEKQRLAQEKFDRQIEAHEKALEQITTELGTVQLRLNSLAGIAIDEAAAAAPHDAAHTLTFLSARINALREAIRRSDEEAARETDLVISAFTAYRGTYPDRFYETHRAALVRLEHEQGGRQWLPALEEWFDPQAGRHLEARRVLFDQASLLGQSIDSFRSELDRFRKMAHRFSSELQSCIDGSADFDRISDVNARITSRIDDLSYWRPISQLSAEFELWASRGDDELPHEEFGVALKRVAECFQGEQGLGADLVDLIDLEIDLVENGRAVTVRDEKQLEHVSSNGLSYLIMVVIFIGFLSRIRRDAPVQVVCSVDELRNIDLPNTERLFALLDRHKITLISAFPDADPDVLRLFAHRYTILEGRRIASVTLDQETYDDESETDEDDPVQTNDQPFDAIDSETREATTNV